MIDNVTPFTVVWHCQLSICQDVIAATTQNAATSLVGNADTTLKHEESIFSHLVSFQNSGPAQLRHH
jgi:hypothetical protein